MALRSLLVIGVLAVMFSSKFLASNAFLCMRRPLRARVGPTRLLAQSGRDVTQKEPEDWMMVDLATPRQRQSLQMEDRIKVARKLQSGGERRFQLDDDDAETLNRMLGIKDTKEKGNKLINNAALDEELDEDLLLSDAPAKRPQPLKTHSRPDRDGRRKLAVEIENARDKSDLPSKIVKGLLDMNPFVCPGCGSNFQSKKVDSPGYLPPEKFQEHRKVAEFIKKKQEAVKILEMADVDLDSPLAEKMLVEAEVDPEVIRSVRALGLRERKSEESSPSSTISSTGDAIIEEHSLNCICQRCFRLQQYGQVEQELRPGWSNNELLTPERFEKLLGAIKESESVVLCIVDIFDLQGSVVKNLRQIAGRNPVVIAVNKVDLLPKDISHVRVTNWVYTEVCRICGFDEPMEREESSGRRSKSSEAGVLRMSNIHLMSCQNDFGVKDIISKVVTLASDNGSKVHVMGAANVGKSSFINKLLNPTPSKSNSNKNKPKTPMVTVSNLPGTTLDFLKIKLSNGITMIDTPGLINKGHLTSKLTTSELKDVIPSKPINPVTLRLEEGRCVLIGGLAKLEFLEGRPFYFTFFVSNEVKIHLTNSTRAADFVQKHIGKLIFPPHSVERLQALEPFEPFDLEVEGEGWKRSSQDVVIPGVGWVAVTGTGNVRIRVTVPQGTEVTTRPSLLPFEAQFSTAKFTGSKILKKSSKSGEGKSYGWRA